MDKAHTQFDGSIPEHYDRGLGPNLFADYGSDLADRVAGASPRAVLELAAGTGIVTRLLRDALPRECALTATDLNEPMLAVARRKFADGEPVTFQMADAQALSFDSESFDTVACQFGVMFFPDKAAAYREVRRVLRPGGRYVFNVWSSFEHNPFAGIAHDAVCRFFPDDPPGFYRVPFAYHEAERISASVEAAGFAEVTVSIERKERTIHDLDQFAHGLVFGNPLVEEVRSRGGVEPQVVKTAILESLGAAFGPAPYTMPLQALVIEGVRR